MSHKKSPVTIAMGHAIRLVRREHSYSQEGFAARAALDRGYYGAIERGEINISLETLAKLAAALETSCAALFRRAGL